MLALAAQNGWAVDSFDFDQAYLNSKLADDDVIYVEQPLDYETKDMKEWVLGLMKLLYGLKQAVKNWYKALYKALMELGFMRCEANHGMFFKEVGSHIIIFLVHVDNWMVTGSDVDEHHNFLIPKTLISTNSDRLQLFYKV